MSDEAKRNRLSREQFYKLTEALRLRAEGIRERRPVKLDLARSLTKDLGFTVSYAALKEASDLIGLAWESTAPGASTRSKLSGRLKSLEERSVLQEERLIILRNAFQKVCQHLGLDPAPLLASSVGG